MPVYLGLRHTHHGLRTCFDSSLRKLARILQGRAEPGRMVKISRFRIRNLPPPRVIPQQILLNARKVISVKHLHSIYLFLCSSRPFLYSISSVSDPSARSFVSHSYPITVSFDLSLVSDPSLIRSLFLYLIPLLSVSFGRFVSDPFLLHRIHCIYFLAHVSYYLIHLSDP